MADIYADLPYPFPHLPEPGEPVDAVVVSDAILPLLHTVHCVLDAFTSAAEHGDLLNDHLGTTMGVLTGYLGLVIDLLQRLAETEGGASED